VRYRGCVLGCSRGSGRRGGCTGRDSAAAAGRQAYIQSNPRKTVSLEERTAYVLPKDYAYGFRGPIDKVWGLWAGDNFSYSLSAAVHNMLIKYGNKLDIIYDDVLQPDFNYGYRQLIRWDSTISSPVTLANSITSSKTTPAVTPTHPFETPTSPNLQTDQSNPPSGNKDNIAAQIIYVTAVATSTIAISLAALLYYKNRQTVRLQSK
jgi:hypothetical protein